MTQPKLSDVDGALILMGRHADICKLHAYARSITQEHWAISPVVCGSNHVSSFFVGPHGCEEGQGYGGNVDQLTEALIDQANLMRRTIYWQFVFLPRDLQIFTKNPL